MATEINLSREKKQGFARQNLEEKKTQTTEDNTNRVSAS